MLTGLVQLLTRITFVFLALMTGLPVLGQAPQNQDARTLAEAIQKRYDQVRDFSADFVHVYKGGTLRMQATERGTVLIKKPGKMRWQYNTPEDKLFVSDGRTMYAYFPADAQVTVSLMPLDDEASAAVLLLTGKGDLVRDFRPEYVDPPGFASDSFALRLEPISPTPDYESLILIVARKNLALRQLISTDRQGGTSTFQFTNLAENLGLADSDFSFTIPLDVEVTRHNIGSQ